jgi:outer membrane receptor for ferrienterochelin and colicins
MHFIRILFLLNLLLCAIPLRAQDVLTGNVYSGKSEPVPGAQVFWQGTSIGTSCDNQGNFRIAWPDSFPALLRVSMTGFQTRVLTFENKSPGQISVDLLPSNTLDAVVIEERLPASQFSTLSPIFAERITSAGLLKAACCNLSESFETNPSVDAAVTDAVSGAKKIQMLGLDGVYSQILFENLPLIRGLSASYGLAYVPGTFIKGILITKGTGSVLNGYESVSGQLNIDLLKPEEGADRYFVNLYANQRGRYEANVHFNRQLNENWGTTLLMHHSRLKQRNDNNNDGFLDMPMYEQYNVMSRWNWVHKNKVEGQFGIRALQDDRTGGQFAFNKASDYGTTNFWGMGIVNRQLEFFNKTGFVFKKPGRSIGTMFSARWHEQDMFFGLKTYSGEQRSIYANVIWQDNLGNGDKHGYKLGASLVFDEYRELFNDSAMFRPETAPGVFAEYTGHLTARFSIVAGLRADMHSVAGFQLTPRVHAKYDLTPKTAVRVSGGKGFRTANIFTENSAIFASSRTVKIDGPLKAEIAWNYGGSLQQKFKLGKEALLIIDFFRTDFQNQVVMDMETPGLLRFYNLQGKSFANSLQADLSLEPVERFDLRFAYKWYDIRTTYSGQLKSRPLMPVHRAFFNIGYATPYDRWKFDATVKWMGQSRLPNVSPHAQHGGMSDTVGEAFWLFNVHVLKNFRTLSVYAGCDNVFNFMQHNAILLPDQPFAPEFDASLIYGPMDGRIIYAGIRYAIN